MLAYEIFGVNIRRHNDLRPDDASARHHKNRYACGNITKVMIYVAQPSVINLEAFTVMSSFRPSSCAKYRRPSERNRDYANS